MTPENRPENAPPEEVRELMLLLASGQVEPEERARALQLLLAGDPDALAARAEAEELLAQLSLALPPVAPPAGVRAALLHRVAGPAAPAAPPPPRPAGRILPWTLAGGALAAAVALAVVLFSQADDLRHQRETIAELRLEVAAQRQYLQLLETDRATLASLRDSLAAPEARVVSLAGAPAQPSASGRLLFDPARGVAWFYGRDFRPPGAGKDYQLWYVTEAGEKRSLGTFDPDASGRTASEFAFEPTEEAVQLAAVTDEPDGGSPQPTGEFQLLGEFK